MKKGLYFTLFVLTAIAVVIFSFFMAVYRTVFKKRQASPMI